MRLLLLNPTYVGRVYYGQPSYYADNVAVFPPLSLLPLYAYVRQSGRHEVRVLDMALERTTLEDLKGAIESWQPDVVGITCVISQWYSIVEILRFVKRCFPAVVTVAGGYNCQVYPAETLRHECVDFMVLGSGQEPLLALLDGLAGGKEARAGLEAVRGLFPRDSQKRNFAEEYRRENPDAYPMADRSCTPYRRYRSAISRRFPSTVMISADGCPFRCHFCNTSGMKTITVRDSVKVVDEMEECVRLGIREVMFQDELFTIREERVLAICDEIVRRKLPLCWNFKSRVNLLTETMIPALRRAGCTNVHFGVESGSDRVLELMNKGITTEQVRRVFANLRAHGLDGSASFMLAYPGETPGETEQTIRFATEIDPAFAQFTITIDYPGTQIYRDNLARGKYKEDIWQRFVLAPVPDFEPPQSSDALTKEEAARLLDSAYRRFYFRPRYLWKRLKRLGSVKELWHQGRIAWEMWRG